MATIRILFLFLCLSGGLAAQSLPPLERLISLDVRNEPLTQTLTAISRAGKFSFSYNPALLPQTKPVTIRVTNRPVRDVLGQVFGGSVRLRSRGNHVILLRADEPEKASDFILDGYVIDGQSAERIGSVSLFEKTSLRSATSNEYGYYRLKLPADLPQIRLEVRRQAYLSQSLTIPSRRSHPQNIYLTAVTDRPSTRPLPVSPLDTRPLPIDSASRTRSVLTERPVVFASADSASLPATPSFLDRSRRTIGRWALSTKQLITDINLDRDTLYRTWQVSLLPGIGTNGVLGGRIINDYSVNALIGYSLGVRKLEVGGFLNLVRGDMAGVQLGGFGNLVGGTTRGVQLGGFVNTNRGDVGPVQAAGFVNTVAGTVHGIQAAGFLNAVGGNLNGLQVAGFLNTNLKTVQGMQLAGFANVAGGNIVGWQVAGFTNIARSQLTGYQLSGFLNVAQAVVSGRQIGFLNVAHSSEKAPIGFFSYVHTNGYRNLDVSANEVTTINATFRTGVRAFYNIFTAGLNPATHTWSYGYGLGTETSERRTWSLAVEGLAHQLNRTSEGVQALNLLLRLNPLVVKRLGSRMGLSVGPTLNAYYADDLSHNPLASVNLPALPTTSAGPGNDRHEWSGWIGWQAGLRVGL